MKYLLARVAEWVWARRGQMSMRRLRFVEAARNFAKASDALPPSREIQKIVYWGLEATAWFRQGDENGDHSALLKSITLYKKLLEVYTRDVAPFDWAAVGNDLADAFAVLGQRESRTEMLEMALVVYREVLEEWTYGRTPLNWAMTQNNMGNVLASLGERGGGTEKLEEVMVVYGMALEVVRVGGDAEEMELIRANLKKCGDLLHERRRDGGL